MNKQDFALNKILTIPNFLSLFRLVLAFAFWYRYTNVTGANDVMLAVFYLVLSGITDILDGKIARRFNMVSELGKILDPFADKITQGMIMIALIGRFPFIVVELVLFTIKSTYMSVAGIMILKRVRENLGARWYGKMNTVILYSCSIFMILWYTMPVNVGNILILISCVSILFTFIMYFNEYQRILRLNRSTRNL
ncbi:MAG: CDP-alcohol phosphatidyltransferase family protein [Erysipelotrichaceae bacterium]